jgi:tetratricopeptide (TPR) repeat protein
MYRLVMVCLITLLSGCASMSNGSVDIAIRDRMEADGFYEAGDCQSALPIYLKITRTLDGDKHSLLRAGNCYAFEGKFLEAAEQYKAATKLDPNFAKAWHNLLLVQARELFNTNTQLIQLLPPDSPLAKKTLNLGESMMQIIDGRNKAFDILNDKGESSVDE